MGKSYERHKVKVLCAALYMLCLCNVLGVSLREARYTSAGTDESVGEGAKSVSADEGTKSVGADEDVKSAGADEGAKSAGVNEEAPKVAITFDDGPSSKYTGKLLDGLKERNVKASFFLIGEYAKDNPELVKRLYDEGHLIGNHTYHHVDITHLSREEAKKELIETDRVISIITGEHVAYMRPPFGVWQQDLEVELEVMPVLWTVDPLDWTTENVSEIVNKVVTEIEENDIILLHDCYDSSVEAALQIIDMLQKRGYEFVTVEEILLN